MATLVPPHKPSSLSKESGFSMIEVLVTILVFAIGLLGVAAMQVQALRGTADSGQRGKAVWLAQELTERMRANPEGVASEDGYLSEVSCNTVPSSVCSNYFDAASSNSISAATCNAVQMAKWDMWELSCGTYDAAATDTKGNMVHFLAGASISLQCTSCANPEDPEFPLPDDSDFTITVSWTGRSGGTNDDGPTTGVGTQKLELLIRP